MKQYYAVIDTNVIVSSFFKKGSIPSEIVNMALYGPIIPLLSINILKEYEEVLLRNKFGFNKIKIDSFLIEFAKRAIFFKDEESALKFIDQDDVVFYEITLTARKQTDAYLITGNIKHFPKEPFVVTPREMLDIIENAKASN